MRFFYLLTGHIVTGKLKVTDPADGSRRTDVPVGIMFGFSEGTVPEDVMSLCAVAAVAAVAAPSRITHYATTVQSSKFARTAETAWR